MTVVERHEGGGARFRVLGIPFRRLLYTLEDGSLHVDAEAPQRIRAQAAVPRRMSRDLPPK